MSNAPTIDAHQHFWRLDRGDYGWLTSDLAPIYRDFSPEDLTPLLSKAGVDGTILVQAAASEAETHFLLDIARQTDFVKGVVGWIDMDADDAPERVRMLAKDTNLVGLRPMIHDIADSEWMLKPALAPVFEAMVKTGLTFDALVRPQHLATLHTFTQRYDTLPIVIDHVAKPDIANGDSERWADGMASLASDSHAWCKLSGMATEASSGWTTDDLRPYVNHVLSSFGPERVIWGSDWPVLNLNGDYASWRAATLELLAELSPDEHAAVLGSNAEKFYGLTNQENTR